MTPLKAIIWCGLQIWTLDWADHAELVCIAGNEGQRDWVLRALKMAHERPVIEALTPPPARYYGVQLDGE